jgi:hypothetical protein
MCPDMPWYQEECRTCAQLGISQEDITLSANRLPPPAELRRVVEVLDRTEYPILIHCKAGADRTGLISALILLLQTDASLATARYQLLPRYGHFRFARTAEIDRFFDLYEEYLAREQRPHTSAYFRDWILTKYQAGPAASELTWALPIPESVPADEYFGLTVRAKNCSNTPWVLKPGTYAGIHLAFGVYNDLGESVWSGRAGLRHEIVPPGRTTDIMIPINPLKPGQYTVIAEIHDATGAGIPFRTNSFVQYGDESLAATLIAR